MMGLYFDNSLTTRPSEKAVAAMLPFYTDRWGSPYAPHQMGQELFPAMEEAAKKIYSLVGANVEDSFVLTSSGAEAINHVIASAYYDIARTTGKNQFITSMTEEAPVLMAIDHLESMGCVSKLVSTDKNGWITVDSLVEAITPRTALISLSWANGLTGVIQPVAEIAALCEERGIALHLDATHVLGKLFYELGDIKPHFLSFNGDHIHAPKGTGGLFIRKGIKCSSFILGGLEQGGLRAGSFNMPGFVALGHAAAEAFDNRNLLCTEVARLRNRLEEGIVKEYPEAIVFFADQERLPHCTAIAFPGIPNEAMLFALNRKNLFASIGGSSFQQIGLILANSGIDPILAHTAISFSLSRETNDDEIDRAIYIISETSQRLRKLAINV